MKNSEHRVYFFKGRFSRAHRRVQPARVDRGVYMVMRCVRSENWTSWNVSYCVHPKKKELYRSWYTSKLRSVRRAQ